MPYYIYLAVYVCVWESVTAISILFILCFCSRPEKILYYRLTTTNLKALTKNCL